MYELYSKKLLTIWEMGEHLHPIDRALLILRTINFTDQSEQLSKLSIGRRNALLLQIQEHVFVRKMDCFTKCVACKEELDVTFDAKKIREDLDILPSTVEQQIEVNGITLIFRLINSMDLAAIVECDSLEQAYLKIAQRCLLKAKYKDECIRFDQLDENVIKVLIKQLKNCEPLAEMLCELSCSECGTRWQQPFDIVNFLWEEIVVYSKKLLTETTRLTKAYGWNEMDIMSMSNVRRKFYLSRIHL